MKKKLVTRPAPPPTRLVRTAAELAQITGGSKDHGGHRIGDGGI